MIYTEEVEEAAAAVVIESPDEDGDEQHQEGGGEQQAPAEAGEVVRQNPQERMGQSNGTETNGTSSEMTMNVVNSGSMKNSHQSGKDTMQGSGGPMLSSLQGSDGDWERMSGADGGTEGSEDSESIDGTKKEWKKAVVILLPLQLGHGKYASPLALPQLEKLLELKWNIGMMGGRPRMAHYVVGHQNNALLYLDPHYVQNCSEDSIRDYMTFRAPARPQTLVSEGVDSSVAFCYYIANAEEFAEFCQAVKQIAKDIKNEDPPNKWGSLLEVRKNNPAQFDLLDANIGSLDDDFDCDDAFAEASDKAPPMASSNFSISAVGFDMNEGSPKSKPGQQKGWMPSPRTDASGLWAHKEENSQEKPLKRASSAGQLGARGSENVVESYSEKSDGRASPSYVTPRFSPLPEVLHPVPKKTNDDGVFLLPPITKEQLAMDRRQFPSDGSQERASSAPDRIQGRERQSVPIQQPRNVEPILEEEEDEKPHPMQLTPGGRIWGALAPDGWFGTAKASTAPEKKVSYPTPTVSESSSDPTKPPSVQLPGGFSVPGGFDLPGGMGSSPFCNIQSEEMVDHSSSAASPFVRVGNEMHNLAMSPRMMDGASPSGSQKFVMVSGEASPFVLASTIFLSLREL